MDDAKLQQWVELVSIRDFGRPFLHQATFNRRLRSTGGRYFAKSHNIEISWLQFETYGAEEVEKIIKHELCHYHLHLSGHGYNHRDPEFKQLLAKVGGTRFCKSIPGVRRQLPYRYVLTCVNCKMEYKRKRKINPRRFACGKCSGRLKLRPLN